MEMQLQPTEAATEKRWHAVSILTIFIVSFLLYSATLKYGFIFSWDDFDYVLNNNDIRGFTANNFKAIFSKYYVGNYAPLHLLSYMIDYQFWGLDPSGYHFANILLHAVNGVLIYRLLLKLELSTTPALLGALLFIMHPAQVESVAWVTERKNILSVLFFLLALLTYIDYRHLVTGRVRNLVLSLCFFACALLSKSAAVILPAVLIVYDFCYCTTPPLRRLNLLDKLPYALLALGASIMAVVSQDVKVGGGIRDYPGGTPVTTLWTMIPVFLSYLKDLIYPLDLSPYYIVTIRKAIDSDVVISAIILLALAIAASFCVKRWPRLLFFISVYILSLLPVMQIIPLITLKNDRYLYFPMIGVAGAVALLISILIKGNIRLRYATVAIAIAVCTALGAVSYRQSLAWKDSISLWKFALQQNPENLLAWAMLAKGYTHLRNGPEAIKSLNVYHELKSKHGPLRGWEGI